MILDRIVADKKLFIEEAKKRRPIGELMSSNGKAKRSIISALQSRPVAVIAEIKRRSPSGGEMNAAYGLEELAGIYERSGAVAISVLTDEKYFGGSPEDLRLVKDTSGLPVLRKDFIVDAYQVFEAKYFGADAILLIAAILDNEEITTLMDLAHELSLEVLLEIHTKGELERAIESGAKLIGINNRNLDTLKTDLATSFDLLEMVPDDRVVISESGISTSSDIGRLLEAGADGFLIGESLLKSGDPAVKLTELLSARAGQ
ncbi:MAG: indole-3-glycerol phosphate synthase TrpC [Candidatus Aquicultor sp.]|nr:indole-3-glycerol phosphate synthase TrpC [Candidatus Aquicultor sp.]